MKKNLLMLLFVLFTLNGCKKSNSPEPESPTHNVAADVKGFANFLEKMRASSNTNRVALKGRYEDEREQSPEPILLPDGAEQYLPKLDAPSQERYEQVQILTERIALPQMLSNELADNLSPAQALIEVRGNVGSILDIQNFTSQASNQDVAVSDNLSQLSSSISDIANDELAKALDIDENTIVNEDAAVEQVQTRLNNRVQACINSHVQSTNYNIGLTSNQKTTIAVSSLYALQALQTPQLMEEISISVNRALDNSLVVLGNSNRVLSKGLFGKIGNFFTKVVKVVAVVAWSAVSIVGVTLLGYLAGESKGGPNYNPNNDATAIGGFLAGVTYVTKNSRKWWGWALR